MDIENQTALKANMVRQVKIGTADERGWYIADNTLHYLYNDGSIHEGVNCPHKKCGAFWKTRECAQSFFDEWKAI